MALLTRRRPKPPLPVTEPTASEQNGAPRVKRKAPAIAARRLLQRHWRAISLLLVIIVLLFRHHLIWMYKNRYLYLNCPEVGFWLRQPFDDGRETAPHIVYLTAKFGTTNGTFAEEINKQVQGVKRLGVLPETAEIISYVDLPQEFLTDPRWKQHVDSLYNRGGRHGHPGRGGGYWFWKPLLLQRHLQQLQEGDFLIYSDSDMLDFFSWLPLLLESMVEWNANLALYQMPFLEQEWTKRDVYEAFCPSLNIEEDKSGQYAGGHSIWRRDKATLKLVQDWVDAIQHFDWVNDKPSHKPNILAFREHRHDQLLLSLLLKCKYGEPQKRLFPWTCLQTWTLTTFRIE